MPRTRRSRNAAAHQAGALFALAGLVTLPGMLTLPEGAVVARDLCG